MFRGTPPFLRVALRHRRWAILGAPLAVLTVLYCSYHPDYYRFSPLTEHVDPQPLSPFPHEVLIVQADLSEFPDYYWHIAGQNINNDHDGSSSSSPDQLEKDVIILNHPLGLLSTTSNNNNDTKQSSFSSNQDFRLPPQQPTFVPGIPKPPNEAYTKALVIAHTKSEQVDWINDPVLNSPPPNFPHEIHKRTNTTRWIPYLYSTNEIFPPSPPINSIHHRPEELFQAQRFHTPLNKGREALAYLSYIITHYDSLPDISVFMHAHSSSWHDDQFGLDSPTTLSRLNLDRVITQGYVNLRCWWDPGCPDHIHPFTSSRDELKPEEVFFREAWLDLFPWRDVPPSISQTCCGQFALSRERIRSVSLAEYVRLRDWLFATELEDSVSGRVFEYIWQVIWTGYEILCPVEWVCYCEGYGICFGDDDDWDWEEEEGKKEQPQQQRKEANKERENNKPEDEKEEKRRKGYERYSLKRDEWMGLTKIVEEFIEGEGWAFFSTQDIEGFADKVEGGESLEDVVRKAIIAQGQDIKFGEGGVDGGGSSNGMDDKREEGETTASVEGVRAEDQEFARKLAGVIKASRRANKVLLPWLMDRMGRAKGEK